MTGVAMALLRVSKFSGMRRLRPVLLTAAFPNFKTAGPLFCDLPPRRALH